MSGVNKTILLLFHEASKQEWISILLQYLLDSVITCWNGLEQKKRTHVCPLKRLPVLKGGSVAKHRAGKFKMVGILSKIPPPAQLLNSKAAGIAVASVGAGILLLWKKKLDDLSAKRYWRSYYQFQPGYSQPELIMFQLSFFDHIDLLVNCSIYL